jgi:hypothetical protein
LYWRGEATVKPPVKPMVKSMVKSPRPFADKVYLQIILPKEIR